MRTKTTGLIATLVLSLAASACGSSGSSGNGASTPTPGGSYNLDDGNYVYTATSASPNTCWAVSKNMPPMPSTINATASNSSATGTTLAFTEQGQSVTINLAKNDNALSGSTVGDVDLASYGITCKLHVTLDMTGTMTANDAFDASEVLNISDDNGSGCGLLIGAADPHQFDQIPCSLTMNGSAVKQ